MVFWYVEIPIIFFIIAGMLLGSIQIGGFLRTTGGILLFAGAVLLLVDFTKDDDDRKVWLAACALCAIQGLIILLIGIWFGDHSLFEFFFGTGWF